MKQFLMTVKSIRFQTAQVVYLRNSLTWAFMIRWLIFHWWTSPWQKLQCFGCTSRIRLWIRTVCVSPEAAAAVLALLPDPSRLAYTHAAGSVTLAVQARLITLLRLRGRGQTYQSAQGCDDENRSQNGAVKA